MRLVLLHAAHHWVRTLLLAAAASVALALPIAGRFVVDRFETDLRERAQTVPLVVGAAGSRFDLVFTSLHFRMGAKGTIELGEADKIVRDRSEGVIRAIPMHVRFTARGEPIAAVGFEYFAQRELIASTGRLPAGLTEVSLGARAAGRLGLGVGDELPSDQRTTLDITAPSSIVLRVVGVLQESGSPDDDAVFTELSTAWLLEGISHGHAEAETITDPSSVLGRSGDAVALSGAVPTAQRVTDANAGSFHLHAERSELPITAVLVYPPSEKAATILAARYNARPGTQAVRPERVVDELVSFVIRLRAVFDAIAMLLGATTAALIALIASLSVRIREDELRTLADIGASRRAVAVVALGELLVVGMIAASLAAVEVAVLAMLASTLVSMV